MLSTTPEEDFSDPISQSEAGGNLNSGSVSAALEAKINLNNDSARNKIDIDAALSQSQNLASRKDNINYINQRNSQLNQSKSCNSNTNPFSGLSASSIVKTSGESLQNLLQIAGANNFNFDSNSHSFMQRNFGAS